MAVNLVSPTTINRTVLYRGQPGTSIGTVYTVPGSTDVKIASMIFCNTTGTAATITVSVVNTGGTAGVTNRVVSGLVILANAVDTFDSVIYMNTGDFIAALQGTASAITMTVSGETYA
jgi:hypothetical protein